MKLAENLGNSAKLFIGKRRWLKRWLMPKRMPTLYCEIPQHHIKLYVDARDMRGPSYYVMFGGPDAFDQYEREEKNEVIQALPEDGVFLDIGANIGLFAISANLARPRARTIAFEPHPDLRKCFFHTLKANHTLQVELYPYALANHRGSASLFIDETDSGGHSLDLSQLTNNKQEPRFFTVDMISLDELEPTLKLHRLDIIKIDVQGNEIQVLMGAKKTLTRFRPTLLVECDLVQVKNIPLEFLSELNYRFREVSDEKWKAMQDLPEFSMTRLSRGTKQTNLIFSSQLSTQSG